VTEQNFDRSGKGCAVTLANEHKGVKQFCHPKIRAESARNLVAGICFGWSKKLRKLKIIQGRIKNKKPPRRAA
jgi:hypothetical protein